MPPPDPKRRKRPGQGALENNTNNDSAGNRLRRAGVQADQRFRNDVIRLYALGPRVIYELLAELGARRLCRSEIEQLVGQYAQLDPKMLRAVWADRMPPLPPLRVVPR